MDCKITVYLHSPCLMVVVSLKKVNFKSSKTGCKAEPVRLNEEVSLSFDRFGRGGGGDKKPKVINFIKTYFVQIMIIFNNFVVFYIFL